MWRDSFSARQNRKADEEAVSSHQWDEYLAYETVGYAPDYVTLGSLVNSVKGGSYHTFDIGGETQKRA
jgi:hypothetical protein